ncbi:carbon-nitrogen hydrolase [Coniochaeta ligniaria NRRL 30616]|uniref:Carbon-nitrogen hydrolase n=1 Tax=Coniochaeta ligniaria NRRL 30616 TaxID=1408157 RepID=A0A1J7JJF6_9PEZI|nr:carbon-nitrogen hydrolase [Coniochaeta ligniaria NRRL 30616]
MTSQKIRLGTASPASQSTTGETLSQLSRLARRAAEKQIDILVLPEAYLGGYPRGTAFGCVVGGRSEGGRDEYLRYFRGAVDLGDEVGDGGAGGGDRWVARVMGGEEAEARGDGTREELEKIAKETGVFLVVGCIERAGGSLYCSVVYVDPKLGALGKRRKVMPTATERLIWAQGSPATLKAVSTVIKGVRINLAAAICWENYMPLLRQSLYAQNVNLYLAPTADGRDAWLSLMRTVGIEGRCFVVSSNMCVREQQNSKSKTDSVVVDGDDHPEQEGKDSVLTQDNSRQRRKSCVTEEGFEIALPSPSLSKTKSRRRQSIFDGDGNEIVLCSKDGAIAEEESTEHPFTAPSYTTTQEEMVKQVRTQAKATTNGNATQFVSRGGSSIVSPFGDVLAGPQWEDDDGIIYADVDFDDCVRGRLDLDVAGSYSRNDSFKFSVQGLDMTPLPYWASIPKSENAR